MPAPPTPNPAPLTTGMHAVVAAAPAPALAAAAAAAAAKPLGSNFAVGLPVLTASRAAVLAREKLATEAADNEAHLGTTAGASVGQAFARPYYAAVFLSLAESGVLLKSCGGAAHPGDVRADHITLAFGPSKAELFGSGPRPAIGAALGAALGDAFGRSGGGDGGGDDRGAATGALADLVGARVSVNLRPGASLAGPRAQAVPVRLPEELAAHYRGSSAPHCTLSVAPGASAADSNALLLLRGRKAGAGTLGPLGRPSSEEEAAAPEVAADPGVDPGAEPGGREASGELALSGVVGVVVDVESLGAARAEGGGVEAPGRWLVVEPRALRALLD
mmetsp:Transcript_63816/g.143949  ORF Transcript_63816/g.143949 Transcript_63816/m.143949 type:complete len:333 (-) Transcript_63816:75-1073(-)